jgi:hypothetical protein
VNEQFIDGYYKKIPEDRKRDLLDEVAKRRKLVTESEMRTLRCEDILNEFQVKYQHFQDSYLYNEERRRVAFEQIKDLHIMKDYLVDLSASEQVGEQQKDLAGFNTLEQKQESEATKHLESIIMWSKIADNFTQDDLR